MQNSPELDSVLAHAVRYAEQTGSRIIATPHAFVALLECRQCQLASALKLQPVSVEKVKEAMLASVQKGELGAKLVMTQRLVENLRRAADIAQLDLSVAVSPDHFAMSILTERDGTTVELLRAANLDLNRTVDDIRQTRATPILDQYGRDLSELAQKGSLMPVVGRQREITSLTRSMLRKGKNNPMLVGPAGIGKTAIVEGLAQVLHSGQCPPQLQGMRIVELSVASLVAGTHYRGDFEERLIALLDELRNSPEVIVFIDEIHTIFRAGAAQGSALDAGNILKPALARGEIRCIGATTDDEYAHYIEQDPALARRFIKIPVLEPTQYDTLEILRGLLPRYEAHHGVEIADDALIAIVSISTHFIEDRRQPDKAIDLLDELCTRLAYPTQLPHMNRLLSESMKTTRANDEGISDGQRVDCNLGPEQIKVICRIVNEWTGKTVTYSV